MVVGREKETERKVKSEGWRMEGVDCKKKEGGWIGK